MGILTIATWNLERPSSGHSVRARRIQSTIEAVGADVWVLTETRATFAPSPNYFSAHSQPHADRRPDSDERWASIWSRWPTTSLWEDSWSVTARVESPSGELLVHGVVLPYMNEPGPGGLPVRGWSRFTEELGHQRNQWLRVRAQYPAIPFVVAGDLNQSLDGSRWYGSHKTRRALHEAINAAGLKCFTLEDVVASGTLRSNHLVDHICATDGVIVAGGIKCWEPRTIDGLRMSDHPGVALHLAPGKRQSDSYNYFSQGPDPVAL
jgi:endonuclease/exonuclease/phosphatase family metal-dependent hydrolase